MLTGDHHDVPKGKVAMIVTHLEMTDLPETRELRIPDGVNFRKVTPDLGWYRDTFDRVGRDWLWFGRLQLSDSALMDILNDTNVDLYTLTVDGKDEALLELDFRKTGECELAYFGLTSKLIGSGAGRYLIDQAIALAWEQPISRFHLHTCTLDSPQALPFYLRNGFTPYRLQVEIDDDPRLTGLLPEDTAPHVPIIR